MEYQKSAGLIIYYLKNNKPFYLLLKYPYGWGFVKGLIEKQENEKQAAIRELKEETNLDKVEIIKDFEYKQEWFFKLNKKLIKKQAIYLLGKITKQHSKQTKISHEHEDFCYLDFKQAIKKIKIKPNKELLTKAHEFIIEYEKQKKLF